MTTSHRISCHWSNRAEPAPTRSLTPDPTWTHEGFHTCNNQTEHWEMCTTVKTHTHIHTKFWQLRENWKQTYRYSLTITLFILTYYHYRHPRTSITYSICIFHIWFNFICLVLRMQTYSKTYSKTKKSQTSLMDKSTEQWERRNLCNFGI